jgi:hypothetical protein
MYRYGNRTDGQLKQLGNTKDKCYKTFLPFIQINELELVFSLRISTLVLPANTRLGYKMIATDKRSSLFVFAFSGEERVITLDATTLHFLRKLYKWSR